MRYAITFLTALILVAGFAQADATCVRDKTPTATLDTPTGTYYVLNEACQPDCLFSVWIIQETNGIAGLQVEEAGPEDGCYPTGTQPDGY